MAYHEGELAVQTRAGVKAMAQRIARGIHSEMPEIAQSFLEAQSLAVAASVDAQGHVWASALAGWPGFLSAEDAQTVRIETTPLADDPLFENVALNGQLGLIVIDFSTRQRIRLNGTVTQQPDGLRLSVHEAYSNCPKYISVREPEFIAKTAEAAHKGSVLTTAQQQWIAQADTFFIASAHATGLDASHRGGRPGFVRLTSESELMFPDYAGNMMFNTLGNLQANPHAGLLFLDFERGSTLQISGHTEILWEGEAVDSFPRAERVIRLRIDAVIEIPQAIPFHFDFLQASPTNPPLTAE